MAKICCLTVIWCKLAAPINKQEKKIIQKKLSQLFEPVWREVQRWRNCLFWSQFFNYWILISDIHILVALLSETWLTSGSQCQMLLGRLMIPTPGVLHIELEQAQIFWASSCFRYLASSSRLCRVVKKEGLSLQALEILRALLKPSTSSCVKNDTLPRFETR